MRKTAVSLLIGMMTIFMAGCGREIDASAYVEALLDNFYKNDPSGFIEMRIGTKEEGTALYEQELTVETEALLASVETGEEQKEAFCLVVADIFSAARYTVGEALKQEDGSYVVTVSYETMNIFEPAMKEYEERVRMLFSQWTTDALAGREHPANEERMGLVIEVLRSSLEDSLKEAAYDEPKTTTIRLELEGKVYTPNSEDMGRLKSLLFDVEKAAKQEGAE